MQFQRSGSNRRFEPADDNEGTCSFRSPSDMMPSVKAPPAIRSFDLEKRRSLTTQRYAMFTENCPKHPEGVRACKTIGAHAGIFRHGLAIAGFDSTESMNL